MGGWSGEIVVTEDLAGALAERLAAAGGAGAQIALTGGSTPKAAYERAATMDVDWSRAELWFGDDRCVPPGDERSNFGMTKAALLDRIDGAAPTVHRIEGELGPDEGAARYEAELRRRFGEATPELDLVLLGLGPDAHVASLFPGKPALAERERLVVGVEEAGWKPFVSRVTLTLPALNAAREVLFLVSGADKAEAVERAFSGEPDPAAPGSLVAPQSGRMTLLADAPALERLRGAGE